MGELDRYLKEIGKYNLLNSEEEIGLQIKRDNGDKSTLDTLINHNLRLVVNIAKNYQSRGLPLPDLVQEGNIGLIKAAEKYDHKKGNKFASYARECVRTAIERGVANKGRNIRIPVWLNELNYTIRKELDKKESLEYIAKITGKSEEYILKKKKKFESTLTVSFDAPISKDGETGTIGTLLSNNKHDPEKYVDSLKDLSHILDEELTEKEAEIIKLRFKIKDGDKHSLKEIGNTYGVSIEMIRRIQNKALEKLKNTKKIQELEYLVHSD